MGFELCSLIAQSNGTGASAIRVIGWSLFLILSLVALFVLVVWLRRWIKSDDEPVKIGFSLSELRAMHSQGEISDAEYERAKSKMMASAKSETRLIDPLEGRRRAPRSDNPHSGSG